MVMIKNRQRKIKIALQSLEKKAEKMLAAAGYPDFDLGILLTTNASIRKLNKNYRGKDKPTDILSFSYHDSLKAGERIKVLFPEDKNLGDLIISLEYTKKDAPRWGHTFSERLIVLLAHGIAHLLGHDHETDEEFKVMQKLERKLLKTVQGEKD